MNKKLKETYKLYNRLLKEWAEVDNNLSDYWIAYFSYHLGYMTTAESKKYLYVNKFYERLIK